MDHPGFFERAGPFRMDELAAACGAEIRADEGDAGELAGRQIEDVRPIDLAGPGHVTFLDNRKYAAHLATTRASACLISPDFVDKVPDCTVALATAEPYRGFARALSAFYPPASTPQIAGPGAVAWTAGGSGAGGVDPTAELEEGVIVEPGAVVGAEAQIGRGTRVASGAVVGYRVTIGRDSFIGPNASVTHALVGDRVIIHAGVQIGQDGFGFAMGPSGHLKVPQIGRVIIQDDVEIGANSTVDRGALKDTVIGEGTKIDNLVQIAHNVEVGRHCVLVAQTGIAGSTVLEDFVVVGGQTAIVGHVRIGAGAQVAGGSGVTNDVPAGARMGGRPARPIQLWAREVAALKRLAQRK